MKNTLQTASHEDLRYTLPPRARIAPAFNVGRADRIATGTLGGLLAAAALRRRGWLALPLLAVGAELLRRAATGHCHLYSTLGISTAGLSPQHGSRRYDAQIAGAVEATPYDIKRVVTIHRPAADVAGRLRRPAELLGAFAEVRDVVEQDNRLEARYVPNDGAAHALQLGVELQDDGRRLIWHCHVDGRLLAHGVLLVGDAPGERGAELSLAVVLPAAPARYMGGVLAGLLQPGERIVRKYLREAKQIIETGHPASAEMHPARSAAERRLPPFGRYANPQFASAPAPPR